MNNTANEAMAILSNGDKALILEYHHDGYTDEQLVAHVIDGRTIEWRQAIQDIASGKLLEAIKQFRMTL